jgi:hypothetical protein
MSLFMGATGGDLKAGSVPIDEMTLFRNQAAGVPGNGGAACWQKSPAPLMSLFMGKHQRLLIPVPPHRKCPRLWDGCFDNLSPIGV